MKMSAFFDNFLSFLSVSLIQFSCILLNSNPSMICTLVSCTVLDYFIKTTEPRDKLCSKITLIELNPLEHCNLYTAISYVTQPKVWKYFKHNRVQEKELSVLSSSFLFLPSPSSSSFLLLLPPPSPSSFLLFLSSHYSLISYSLILFFHLSFIFFKPHSFYFSFFKSSFITQFYCYILSQKD